MTFGPSKTFCNFLYIKNVQFKKSNTFTVINHKPYLILISLVIFHVPSIYLHK